MVEVFTKLSKFREPMNLGAWLRTIAIRRSIDVIRTRNRVESIGEVERPESDVARNDLREQVLEAISKLGKAQRETVTLFYINGYSVAEVAAMQESPVGTVKRRLHEARRKLKEEMMETVEGVLKSEAPKENFGQQVFEVLAHYSAQPCAQWDEVKEKLRAFPEPGMDGFIRALESPRWRLRYMAQRVLGDSRESREDTYDIETVINLLVATLGDSNKKVRKGGLIALVVLDVDRTRKIEEFVPLMLPLMRDVSKRVRRAVAYDLYQYADVVPLSLVAQALATERDRVTALWFRRLQAKVLAANDG